MCVLVCIRVYCQIHHFFFCWLRIKCLLSLKWQLNILLIFTYIDDTTAGKERSPFLDFIYDFVLEFLLRDMFHLTLVCDCIKLTRHGSLSPAEKLGRRPQSERSDYGCGCSQSDFIEHIISLKYHGYHILHNKIYFLKFDFLFLQSYD